MEEPPARSLGSCEAGGGVAEAPRPACAPRGRPFRSRRTPSSAGVFALVADAKTAAAASGLQVMDLSVGTPDMPPPPEAVEALREATADASTYRYCLRQGTMPLLEAAVSWYHRNLGPRAELDPRTEALALVGSQEGLAHLLLAVADPGDGVLLCDVGYASYLPSINVASLVPRFLPMRSDGSFLPDLSHPAAAAAAAASRLLLLNYPNNPTSAVADEAFWAEALAFCGAHDLLVNDAPYVAQVYSGSGLAASPLALPGAKSRTVELFSFAKSYQMGGCRLGFALGNAEAIAALEAVKAPIDFNQYLGIQRMGVACLGLPHSRLREYSREFEGRAQALTAALRELAGWEVPMPKACMYCWARLPNGFAPDDTRFALSLLAGAGVAVSPGSAFGPGGCGYVRFALVQPVPALREAAHRVAAFLSSPAAGALRAPAGWEGEEAAAVEAEAVGATAGAEFRAKAAVAAGAAAVVVVADRSTASPPPAAV